MQEVNKKATEVSDKIESILSSNQEIMDNINIISDTSTTALNGIQYTLEVTNNNRVQVEETKQIGNQLLESSSRLKNYL